MALYQVRSQGRTWKGRTRSQIFNLSEKKEGWSTLSCLYNIFRVTALAPFLSRETNAHVETAGSCLTFSNKADACSPAGPSPVNVDIIWVRRSEENSSQMVGFSLVRASLHT